jgi:hypothetical protein
LTGPFELGFQAGDVFPSAGILIAIEWSSQSNSALAGYNNNVTYPWVSDNAGFPANGGDANIAQAGINIGTNDAPAGYPTDYAKTGLDDLTGGGVNGVWELRRSFYLYQANGNTEPQIRALMQ